MMPLPARAAFALLPLAALAGTLWLMTTYNLPVTGGTSWAPSLGINLAWRIDGLGLMMLLMISGIGLAVFVYAGGYMAGHPAQRRLFVLLSLFMGAMIGCVTADNLITLFLFWETTSLLSFMLVGLNHDRAETRKSAQQALLVTGTGGLALLAGFILLMLAFGTSSISAIVAAAPEAEASPQLVAGLLLVLVGAFTKSAQFPFHFWLPNAMAAPTPVSAYLHSATMVKLGVYLLARLDAGFGDWTLWIVALQTVGSVTAAWAMLLALRERDLKRILAWSTVATLGTLVALVGFRGEGATVATGALLLAHALYKAPLFFVAGNIDHGTGTRIIDRLGGLRHAMPWTAAAALLAGLSMAGMPLSFGYVVKEAIYNAKSGEEVLALARLANTVFGAIAVAVAGVAAVRVFWRRPGRIETPDAHEGGLALILPPLLLAAIGVTIGLFPVIVQGLLTEVSESMTPEGERVLVHLTNPVGLETRAVLATMGATLLAGAAIFWWWDPLHRLFQRPMRAMARFGFAAHYDRSLNWIPKAAAIVTRAVQHGRFSGYMTMAVAVLAVALAAAAAVALMAAGHPAWTLPPAGAIGGALLVAAGAIAAMFIAKRLVMVLAAGLVGYGSAILFLFAGAPDVALTQFSVETVFVIVATAVLLALRRTGLSFSTPERFRPAALAAAALFAAGLTGLMLATAAVPFDDVLSRYFAETSVPEAFGRNVVNVILVDFRALDTLGEVAVVMLSFIAAVALLRLAGRKTGEDAP